MRYGALAYIASLGLLAGCSFIDDWTTLSTRPGTTQDGGMNDAGTGHDSGPSCTDTCEPATGCPNAGEVCAVAADGCLACQACTGCDPSTCPTACEVVSGTSQCVCRQSTEGGPCLDSSHCEAGLICYADVGACLRVCNVDSECTGVFSTCIDTRCYRPSNETDCANGVDDDGDGSTDCEDIDCAGQAVCAGPGGGEWESCADGACMPGLICRSNVCYRSCGAAADCGGDFPDCADVDSDGVFECTPQLGCDFVANSGCAAAYECRPVSISPTGEILAGCVTPRGGLGPGADCSATPDQCGVRLECLGDGTNFRCYRWCYEDDPGGCPAGEACNPVTTPSGENLVYMSRGVGVCA